MPASTKDDIELAGHHGDHELRNRKESLQRELSIVSRPFAGRIGGNQQFTISPSDASYHKVVSEVPDATAKFTWKQSFSLRGFSDIELWKQAIIEGVGTCLQIWLAGLYAIGLSPI